MSRSRGLVQAPINLLPMDLSPEDQSFANITRCKIERRNMFATMKKPPEGDDVTMVSAYQETQMLRSEKLLHEAAKLNKTEVVVKLLAKGINVNCNNNLDRTPIQWAAAHGAKDVVKVLLHQDANIESEDKYGMRATLWAAWFGHLEVLKFLLACGAKPDTCNRQGLNILHCAASQNRVEIIDFIVDYLENFNLDLTDKQAKTALHCAAKEGHFEALDRLIRAMKKDNLTVKDKLGQTPFLNACGKGSARCVESLLQKGCDINEKDSSGKTALHLAAENGHTEVCEVLLKFPEAPLLSQSENDDNEDCKSKNGKGAKPETEVQCFKLHDATYDTKHENSALHLCVLGGHSLTVRTLAENGCNVNAQNSDGNTPLHLAATLKNSRPTIVQLIRNGAFINQANFRLQTPLHVAVEKGSTDSVQELLNHGANARAEEKTGRNALYMATRGSFTDVVDLIIKAELRNDKTNENQHNSHTNNAKSVTHTAHEVEEALIKQNGGTIHTETNPEKDEPLDEVDADLTSLPGEIPNEEDEKLDTLTLDEDNFEHPHASLIKPILHKLSHKQLNEQDWKKLARLLKFSPEHIKAIEHHYEGKHSYRNHGYRMLVIWLHGQTRSSNPTVELYQGLIQIGKKTLAEQIKNRILLACGEEEVRKERCTIS